MDAHDRRIARRLACFVAVALAVVHRGHFLSTDELGLFFQTEALAHSGSLEVPERVHLSFRGADARTYSQYVVGQSLLALPLYTLGALALAPASEETRRTLAGPIGPLSWQGEPPVEARAFAVLFYPPLIGGLLAAAFFAMERALGVSRRSALAAALTLAFCTHAALMSTLFLQHATEALLALAAFTFWRRYRASAAPRDVLLGAACAAAIFNVRAAGALNGLALGGYLAFVLAERLRASRDPRALARALAAAALPLAASALLYVAMNWLKWGALFESPQLEERSTFGADPREALLGFGVSPGMSVFVYSPPLLLAAWGMPAFWRRFRAEAAMLLALFASTLAVYSSYALWTGLFSAPGPRYLFVPMVFTLLALGGWLDRARSSAARGAFAALAGLGACVQLLSIGISFSQLSLDRGWYTSEPRFGFVFEWSRAPLAAALREAANPAYWDLWLPRTALGWPGQPGRPALAFAVFALWCAATLVLALRLRRALAAADSGEPGLAA